MVPNTVLILLQWSRLQCPVSGWGHGPGSSRPQHCTAQLSILEAVLRSPVAETSAVVASTSLSPLLSWPWLSHPHSPATILCVWEMLQCIKYVRQVSEYYSWSSSPDQSLVFVSVSLLQVQWQLATLWVVLSTLQHITLPHTHNNISTNGAEGRRISARILRI